MEARSYEKEMSIEGMGYPEVSAHIRLTGKPEQCAPIREKIEKAAESFFDQIAELVNAADQS